MSFILDALRKSDAERQRGVAPGLADVRYAASRRRNLWVPVLAVVLTLNIGFMAWQWYAGRDRPVPAAAVEPAVPPVPAAPAPAAAPVSVPAAVPAVRALAREAVMAESPAAPELERDLPGLAAVAPQPAAPAPTPVIAAPPVTPPPARPSKIIADPALPTLDQLLGTGAVDLPPLNLDLLVYNESPTVRFVVINGRKYREGAQLSEGPTLESITPENVILTSQGRRFSLDRK